MLKSNSILQTDYSKTLTTLGYEMDALTELIFVNLI